MLLPTELVTGVKVLSEEPSVSELGGCDAPVLSVSNALVLAGSNAPVLSVSNALVVLAGSVLVASACSAL